MSDPESDNADDLDKNAEKDIDTLEVDVDVIESKNKRWCLRVDDFDRRLGCLLPVTKKRTFRTCYACLDAQHKRFLKHHLLRDMESFSENLRLNADRCKRQNFQLRSAISSTKKAICNALNMEPEDVEELLENLGARKRSRKKTKADAKSKIRKAEAVKSEIQEASHENEMLQKKVEFLYKQTEWLTKDVEVMSEKLAECNKKRLRDKACVEQLPDAEQKVLKAQKSWSKIQVQLNDLKTTNMNQGKLLKSLSESIDAASIELTESLEETNKVLKTKKRLSDRWKQIREKNHNETVNILRKLEIMKQDFANDVSICQRVESIKEAKADIMTKVADSIAVEEVPLAVPDEKETSKSIADSDPEVDESNEQQQQQLSEDVEQSFSRKDNELQRHLNSLIVRREKLKMRHEEKSAHNALLAAKLMQLNRILDNHAQDLLNLQKIRLDMAERKIKLKQHAQRLENLLQGSSSSINKAAKPQTRLRSPKASSKDREQVAELDALSEENELLNLLASRTLKKSVEDFSLYTTLTVFIKENLKQKFGNAIQSFEKTPMPPTSSSSENTDTQE